MEDIRDLKPIFDFSDYYHILLIALGILALFLLAIFLYKKFSKRDNRRAQWVKEIKNIDLNNPKEAAYKITKYGYLLCSDDKNKEILDRLIKKLEQYKYKKEVPESLDEESISYYKTFLESIDE